MPWDQEPWTALGYIIFGVGIILGLYWLKAIWDSLRGK